MNTDPPRTPPKSPPDEGGMATTPTTASRDASKTPPTVPRLRKKDVEAGCEQASRNNCKIDRDENELVDEVLSGMLYFLGDKKQSMSINQLNFDLEKTMRVTIRSLKAAHADGKWVRGKDAIEIVAGGSTQNGKTMIKKSVVWACGYLGVRVILISTTKRGTTSVVVKLISSNQDNDAVAMPSLISLSCSRRVTNTIKKILKIGGGICCHDAAARIEQIAKAFDDDEMREIPTVLIVDEADAFYRRYFRDTRLEKAMKALNESVKPIFRLSVSATLIPVFLHLKQEKKEIGPDSIIFTECRTNYVGPDSFVPLQHNGKDVFFDPDDSEGPEKTMNLLYEQAFQKKGSLTLVIAYRIMERMHEEAARVQKSFPHVAALIITCKGITLKPPLTPMPGLKFDPITDDELQQLHDKFKQQEWTVSDVIELVDKRFQIETPLAVFGYFMMIRSDSFVSSKRVPDFLICKLGAGMSIEKLVQACGRATYQRQSSNYNIKDQKRVTILTYPQDYDTFQAYPRFMAEIERKLRQPGVKLAEALSPATSYTHRANIKPEVQTRSVGQRLDALQLNVNFRSPPQNEVPRGRKWLNEKENS
eukprot:758594-Hanusia_phi.AAC.2